MNNKIETLLEMQKDFKIIKRDKFYNSKEEFLHDYYNYLNEHPELEKELNILKNTIILGKYTTNALNVFYVDKKMNSQTSDYVVFFQEVYMLYKEDKNAAIKKVSSKCTKEMFRNKLNFFKKRFMNANLYTDVFEDILNNLPEERKIRKTYVDIDLIKQYKIDLDILKAIYDSNLSLFDYAFYNDIDYTLYYNYINKSKNEMAIAIKNRKTYTEELLKEIVTKINTGEMDFIDYYKVCKLNPKYIRRFLNKFNVHGKKISDFIYQNIKPDLIRVRLELEGKLVINSEEVPREIKEQAINYIKEIGAPLSNINYKTTVKRLMKERVQ